MIAHVMRLTLWEWFKLRRRWMPFILLAVGVILAQVGLWFAFAAYHNETLQAFASGGSNSFGVVEEVDGEKIDLEASCVSLENEGLPSEIDKLSEERRTIVLREVEKFREESCGNTARREDLRRSFTIPHSIAEGATGLVRFAPHSHNHTLRISPGVGIRVGDTEDDPDARRRPLATPRIQAVPACVDMLGWTDGRDRHHFNRQPHGVFLLSRRSEQAQWGRKVVRRRRQFRQDCLRPWPIHRAEHVPGGTHRVGPPQESQLPWDTMS